MRSGTIGKKSVSKDACIGRTFSESGVQHAPEPLERLPGSELERKKCISRLMTSALDYLTGRFVDCDFEWLLPVMLSKSTDPLWPDSGASIEKRIELEIYGETVRATSSMIIHKIVACSIAHPKLFILSPNIRIEKRERAGSGRHVYEFTQLDFELRDAASEDVRSLVEKTICGLVEHLRETMKDELIYLGRYHKFKIPEVPFRAYKRMELEEKYGKDWERQLAAEMADPVWVTDIPREFYDFEDFESGVWDNYDLMLPEYGEVLSGAKREWEYKKITKKMERDGVKESNYSLLLKLAKDGRLKPSAGGGIGMERLVGWVAGAEHLGETQTFPRVPGVVYEL